jgi:retron-type reverse transcriptase
MPQLVPRRRRRHQAPVGDLLRHATEGTPQGGVISPCLSNVFLHYVLDEWFETEVP